MDDYKTKNIEELSQEFIHLKITYKSISKMFFEPKILIDTDFLKKNFGVQILKESTKNTAIAIIMKSKKNNKDDNQHLLIEKRCYTIQVKCKTAYEDQYIQLLINDTYPIFAKLYVQFEMNEFFIQNMDHNDQISNHMDNSLKLNDHSREHEITITQDQYYKCLKSKSVEPFTANTDNIDSHHHHDEDKKKYKVSLETIKDSNTILKISILKPKNQNPPILCQDTHITTAKKKTGTTSNLSSLSSSFQQVLHSHKHELDNDNDDNQEGISKALINLSKDKRKRPHQTFEELRINEPNTLNMPNMLTMPSNDNKKCKKLKLTIEKSHQQSSPYETQCQESFYESSLSLSSNPELEEEEERPNASSLKQLCQSSEKSLNEQGIVRLQVKCKTANFGYSNSKDRSLNAIDDNDKLTPIDYKNNVNQGVINAHEPNSDTTEKLSIAMVNFEKKIPKEKECTKSLNTNQLDEFYKDSKSNENHMDILPRTIINLKKKKSRIVLDDEDDDNDNQVSNQQNEVVEKQNIQNEKENCMQIRENNDLVEKNFNNEEESKQKLEANANNELNIISNSPRNLNALDIIDQEKKKIRRLKKLVVDKRENQKHPNSKIQGINNDNSCTNQTCAICLSDIIDSLAKLENCNHKFCFSCIKDWSNVTNECPLCKRRFNKIEKMSLNGQIKETIKVEFKQQANHYEDEFYDGNEIDEDADDTCYICETDDNPEFLLICDACSFHCCHTYCCNPPLADIPLDDWFCNYCLGVAFISDNSRFNIPNNNNTRSRRTENHHISLPLRRGRSTRTINNDIDLIGSYSNPLSSYTDFRNLNHNESSRNRSLNFESILNDTRSNSTTINNNNRRSQPTSRIANTNRQSSARRIITRQTNIEKDNITSSYHINRDDKDSSMIRITRSRRITNKYQIFQYILISQ